MSESGAVLEMKVTSGFTVKIPFHPIKIMIYIQDENFDKTHVYRATTGMGGPVTDHANFKI